MKMKRFYLLGNNGTHRYKLMYEWDSALPKIMFIMLNPSYTRMSGKTEVDYTDLSPTSLRVIKYAKEKGFGGVWIGNLFSYITPNTADLISMSIDDLSNKDNDICLSQMADASDEIIFAWGKFEFADQRIEVIKKTFQRGRPVAVNRDGSPAHPLSINFKF